MDARLGSLLIGFAVVVGAGFALFEFGDAARPVGRGTPAPAFSLPRVDGSGRVSLDELRGKVVLVNFWATWCKPCEDEMPAMERLYRRLAGQGFELVAISVDEDGEAVRRFRERYGLTFTILLDPERSAARAYQTFRFPESLLVGPDGVVVERYVGEKRWDAEAYVERIRRLLATRVPSGSA
ncbi:MAG: TlpA disulfide reductase family protein [Myxococcota bacterium]|nr:TlpA disulfide reductase family protein [Myxococcota bacterium]